ncbi:MAG TPA: ribonuclease H-like domain-containing protein [Syntrophales bacterium]|nr:ribonuclease H-like domain-containing protein [Syntrophales bacterium]
MSVRNRLQRLTGETPAPPRPEKPEISELRRRIEEIMGRRREPQPVRKDRFPPLGEVVSGEEIETPHGTFFVVREDVSGGACHGHRRVADLSGLDMARAAILGNVRDMAALDIGDLLFLDTETTGLAGGTGTVAFLIGLGWFEGSRFVLRQIFLRDYAEERAALAHLADLAASRKALVTFNGKAFDLNLLAARFVMNRLPNPLEGFPHLDLLHPSRRLVGRRLENCRLGTLEAALLGLLREDDLPGSEIPERYFRWLRTRDGRLLGDIFRHNRLDILSLAALAAHLSELVLPEPPPAADPRDLVSAARLLIDRGELAGAEEILCRLAGTGTGLPSREARMELSILCKRARRRVEATSLWREMLRDDPGDAFAAEELAKDLEHNEKDAPAALAVVECWLACGSGAEGETAAFLHRRARLRRRTGLPTP